MVCQTGAYLEFLSPPVPNLTYGADNPVSILPTGKTELTLRMHLAYNWTTSSTKPHSKALPKVITVEVKMARVGSHEPPALIPTALLQPTVSQGELQRRELQQGLNVGWGQWVYLNWNSFVLLPDSHEFTLLLCRISTAECQNRYYLNRSPPGHGSNTTVRVGPYAFDRSYIQFYMEWRGLNVSVAYSVIQPRDLIMLVQPLNCENSNNNYNNNNNASPDDLPDVDCSDYYVQVVGSMAYHRTGSVEVTTPQQLTVTPYGLSRVDLFANVPQSDEAHMHSFALEIQKMRKMMALIMDAPDTFANDSLYIPLDRGAFSLSTSKKGSTSAIADALAHARYSPPSFSLLLFPLKIISLL